MSVAIIGCGWLGRPLAKQLKLLDVDVIGTCQSAESLSLLKTLDIASLNLSLPFDKAISDKYFTPLRKDTWVISITPQLRTGRLDYPEKIAQLVELATYLHVKKLILVSSTAALNGLSGNVDEFSQLNLDAPKVATLAQAENIVLKAASGYLQTSVVRMSGLVGEDRHPGRFFKSGKIYKDGSAPVNLIHQKDAVGLLGRLIAVSRVSGIYHGVSTTHATKAEFYKTAALSLNNLPSDFENIQASLAYKHIIGSYTSEALEYKYQIPDLMEWLKNQSVG